MALRLGVDLKVFDAAASKNGDEISIEELSEVTKADPLLVSKSRVGSCLVGEEIKLTINRANYGILGCHGHF